jgi:glycosyltransferase involved in cell wall biosynthesis
MKIPISVVVPVKNEEKNLARCLGRLDRFFEVVVLDSDSTDKTADIALRYGVTLLNFSWNGQYPKKRNWYLLNHKPACRWVLFLDADELVDESFCDSVAAAIQSKRFNGFWLNYSNYFLGKPLRYGLPQRKLALIRVGYGLFEKVPENDWSHLDMEIHEHPIIEGEVGEILQCIEHNDDRGIAKFIDRHSDYAKWEAQRFLVLESDDNGEMPPLTDRQAFKYRNLKKWWYPWFYFFYVFIVKRGFFDGTTGFLYAFYKAWYFLSIRLLILEHKSVKQQENES